MSQRRLRIKRAFELIKDEENGVKFERVARYLLRRLYPNINPLPAHNDLGQDATASPSVPVRTHDRNYTFLFSLKSEWSKLHADLEQCRKHGHKIDVVVFGTWRATGSKQKLWADKILQEYGWDLVVHELEFFTDEALADGNAHFVADELGVPMPEGFQVAGSPPPLSLNAGYADIESELVRLRIEHGVDLRRAWRTVEALEVFATTLSENDAILSRNDRARVHTNLAAAYVDLRDFASAEEHLLRARELRPEDLMVHNNLVTLAMTRSDYAGARRLWEETFRDRDADARARALYSHILWSLYEDEEALKQIEMAISMDPNLSDAYTQYGVILRTRGDLDGAVAALESASKLDQDNYYAHGIRLETSAYLVRQGRGFADVEELDRESSNWLHDLAKAGDPVPKSLEPAAAALWSARGLILMLRSHWDDAARAFLHALTYRQDDAVLHQNLGMAYQQQDRRDEADTEFRTAVRLGARDPILLHNIASYDLVRYYERGDLGLLVEARRYVTEVADFLPDDLETLLLQGQLILAESTHQRSDLGIGRAKRLFRKIVESGDCPQRLSEVAHVNLQRAEDLETRIEHWKGQRFRW